mmetsp:Transcript_45539/g.90236  ORF Transcript_45539/g.90236 Transcript_45539/m.90236 type:complete len:215 (+) Transcript_45539:12-656(+)
MQTPLSERVPLALPQMKGHAAHRRQAQQQWHCMPLKGAGWRLNGTSSRLGVHRHSKSSALSASHPQSACTTPQCVTTATHRSGRAANSWRKRAKLVPSSFGSSTEPCNAASTPESRFANFLPRGISSTSLRRLSGELRMLFSTWSHQHSRAARQSSMGALALPKARHAVCTVRRSGETKITSAPKAFIVCCHDNACAWPVLVNKGSGISASLTL